MRKLLLIFLIVNPGFLSSQVSHLYDTGVALYKQKDYKGAKIILTRVIKKSNYYFEAYTYRAMAYEKLGMLDSAKADFNQALKLKPGFLPALFYRGVMYYNTGEYQKALDDLSAVLKAKPKFVKAYIYRGLTYEAIGNNKEAVYDYTAAIELKLKNYEVYYRRGLLYEKQNMPRSAIEDFSKALDINKNFGEGYLHRGKMYVVTGADSLALLDFEKVKELTDTIKEVYMLSGDLNFKAGNYKAAAADYSVLVEKFRVRDGDLYFKRAEAYFLDSNYQAAYKEYSRTLKVIPRFDKAVVGQAKVYMARGKESSALPLLRKALAFNPQNGDAFYLRGLIYFNKKDYDKALPDFNESIKYAPRAAAYFYRGSCKFEKGDKYGACLDLQKAVKAGYKDNDIKEAVKRVCK